MDKFSPPLPRRSSTARRTRSGRTRIIPTNAWQFARAAFDFAEFSTNDTQRADLAPAGHRRLPQLVAREPKLAAGALLSGDEPRPACARTEFLGALSSSRKWNANSRRRRRWTRGSITPGRSGTLACFIAKRRAGPSSIGSKPQGADYLEQAVKLAPDYPENYLNLVESYLQWNEPDDAKKRIGRARRASGRRHRRISPVNMGAKLGRLVACAATTPAKNSLAEEPFQRQRNRRKSTALVKIKLRNFLRQPPAQSEI